MIISYNLFSVSNLLIKDDDITRVISEHFTCEACGEETECSRDDFQQLQSDLNANHISIIAFSLIPVALFIFLLNFGTLGKFCYRHTIKHITII